MNRTRGRFITTPDLHKRGVTLVLSGAMLSSMSGLLLRVIDVDELTTIFWRAAFAVDATLYVFAINRTSVAKLMIIFGLSPFVAALLAWVVLRERVSAGTWFAMLATLLLHTVYNVGKSTDY